MSARGWVMLILLLWVLPAMGKEYPAHGERAGTLTLYSTLDTAVFEPLVMDFQRMHPGIGVVYENLDAWPQYQRFMQEAREGVHRADMLISTAMDLQVKLVNDGYTAPQAPEDTAALPAWARWRNEAFGFTFEPAVMVFNREAMKGRKVPRSRIELMEAIRRDPAFWRGRIGTYDISRSSVGYLLASQDVRHGSEAGALVEALGQVDVQVEEHTATLLARIERGELVAGYNLLGSYARGHRQGEEKFIVVQPRDHTLVVARTVVIPKRAPHPALAAIFLDYLLSGRGQRVLASQCGLPPLRQGIGGGYEHLGLDDSQLGVSRPIQLGPGLLVYLDREKRRRLFQLWHGVLDGGRSP